MYLMKYIEQCCKWCIAVLQHIKGINSERRAFKISMYLHFITNKEMHWKKFDNFPKLRYYVRLDYTRYTIWQ